MNAEAEEDVSVDVDLESPIMCEGTDWDDGPCPRQATWHAVTTCCRTHFSLCQAHKENHDRNVLFGTEFYCPVCEATPMKATWSPL